MDILAIYRALIKEQQDLYYEASRAQCKLLPRDHTGEQLSNYRKAVENQAVEYNNRIATMMTDYKKAEYDIAWTGKTDVVLPTPKAITVYDI